MPVNNIGTNEGETLTAGTGGGANIKYDCKGGDDIVIASTGSDWIIGGWGSDVMTGNGGGDRYIFSKHAREGDTDYITDFEYEQGDTLKFNDGATIVSAVADHLSIEEFNGRTLNNGSLYDVVLTIEVTDGDRFVTSTVTLMDVVKNQTFSADNFEAYLESIGYFGGLEFADDVPVL